MRKAIVGGVFSSLLFGSSAMASCPITNTLTNGTTADATKVAQNFTDLAACAAPLASPSFTGSVGIGTASPAYPLDIAASGSIQVRVKSSSTGEADLLLDGASGHASQVYFEQAGSPLWASGVTNNGTTGSYAFYSYAGTQVVLYLQSNGNAVLTGTLTQSSDQRLKRNIQHLPAADGIAAINALTPVSFNWKNPKQGGAEQFGFIAQDVQRVLPQLVAHSGNTSAETPDGALTLNYLGLVPVLTKAVQQLSVANDHQAAEITELRTQVASLQKKVGVRTAAR